MRIAYGVEVRDEDDPYVMMLEQAVSAINEASKLKALLLDLVPICRMSCAY